MAAAERKLLQASIAVGRTSCGHLIGSVLIQYRFKLIGEPRSGRFSARDSTTLCASRSRSLCDPSAIARTILLMKSAFMGIGPFACVVFHRRVSTSSDVRWEPGGSSST